MRSSFSRAASTVSRAVRKSVSAGSGGTSIGGSERPSTIRDPTVADVIRYRYHHGVNLGSIFVLEKWLTPSMFPTEAKLEQTSELEGATLWVKKLGIEGARAKFEEHWANALTEEDLDWLVNTAHVSSIRLPIGFFSLGPEFCKGTEFEAVAEIYTNCWLYVQRVVAKARSRGIGVLLDMHALPGGANEGEHSGTNLGKAKLWGDRFNLGRAKFALECLLDEAKKMEGVLGVQIVNEAAADAKGMYEWYDSLFISLYAIDPTMPLYISDGWNLETAVAYLTVHGATSLRQKTNPIVIDTHFYWAFSETDRHRPPQAIIDEVPTKLDELNGKDRNVCGSGAVSVVVGEYSCVLTEECHILGRGAQREDVVREFGQAQCELYQSRASGAFFWTLKMDWMPGGEWGFREQTDIGAITPPPLMTYSVEEIQDRVHDAVTGRDAAMKESLDSHCNYWDESAPNKNYEHWRYGVGWNIGFDDASAFFTMRANGKLGDSGGGCDRIGLVDLWVRKRILESGMRGDFLWEFEHGLRKGIADFGRLTGAY